MLSHLAFNFIDAAGWTCRGSSSPEGLAVKESKTVQFDTNSLCAPSGVLVEEYGRYRLTVSVVQPWRDKGIPTGTKGFYIFDREWYRIPIFIAALPLKRDYLRPWYRVIARIGTTGTDEDFLDPDLKGPVDQRLQEVIRPRRNGELFFYVNDAVLPVRGYYDHFYRNNDGRGQVVIERMP